ncbi:MAG: 3-oxoacyl-[acyl-carrier-protein] reductase [Pseudobdellovibrionaceae bacterium]
MGTNTTLALAGKKVFVTGGSRGIGAAIVRTLAERGAQVAFTYSSRVDAAQTLLSGLPGSGHFHLQLNTADQASVEAAISQTLEKFGEIDGVVNNAGITKDTLLLRMKPEDFDSVINTNLRGTFLVTKGFLKSMIKARKGSIVNITSVIGQTGNAGQANYAASKAGIEAFSRSAAQEVASRGVRVNCIAPGFIGTEMTEVLTDDQKKAILSKIPMDRIAEPSEIATVVSFLISEDSKYITGHTLSVNGGLFMN